MPAIDTSIFDKLRTRRPRSVTDAVAALCAEVSPGHEPSFIEVRPEADALPGECFHNVGRKIERDGGVLVYGWAIWEWPGVFVEAEHHGVWSDGSGIVDVTPHVPACDSILFLPDPNRVYDFAGKRRLLNVKRSIGTFASAQAWIDATDRLQQYVEDCSDGEIVRMDRALVTSLYHSARQAQAQVFVDLALHTDAEAPCICTSGLAFKTCCGPLIDLRV